MQQPAEILERVRHALQKMRLALVKPTKAISSQRLQNAHINVSVEIMQKSFAPDFGEITQPLDIEIQQLLAQLRRQIGLRIVQQGSDVILQRPFAPTLIIQEKWLTTAQHDIAGLEIPIHKILAVGAQQKIRQAVEIVFQRLFVDRDCGRPQKVILEVVQIPGNRLPVKTSSRVANAVVQVLSRLNLKAGQHGHHLAISFHRRRRDILPLAILREKFKQRRVSEVFFEISTVLQILRINFRNRQTVPPKMPGKRQKSRVLLTHAIQNADCADLAAGQPNNLPSRSAQFSLQRLNPLRGGSKPLFKQLLKNVHSLICPSTATPNDNIEPKVSNLRVYSANPRLPPVFRNLTLSPPS